MTSSKEWVRDKRYGRRAGRWANSERVDEALEAIAAMRLAAIAAHQANPEKCPPWPSGRPTDHDPKSDDDWEALARMARARLAAGSHLTALDHEALSMHPNPRSGITGKARAA